MKGQARASGLVMGFDTRMSAGVRACFTSTQPITPTITSQTSPHYAEALDWEYRDREHTLYPSQQ